MPKAGGVRRAPPKRAQHHVRRAVGRNARVHSERAACVRTVGTGRHWRCWSGRDERASGGRADGRPVPAVLRTMRQSDWPGLGPPAYRAVDVSDLRGVRVRPVLDPCGRVVPGVWHLGQRCSRRGRCGHGERSGCRGRCRGERRCVAQAAQGVARADRDSGGRYGGPRRVGARVHDPRSGPTGRRARAGVGDAGRALECGPGRWPVATIVVLGRRRRPHFIMGRALSAPDRRTADPERNPDPAHRHRRTRAHAAPDARARIHSRADAAPDARAHAAPDASADASAVAHAHAAPDILCAAGAPACRGTQEQRDGHLERGWLHGSRHGSAWKRQLRDRIAGPARGADVPMRCLGHGRATTPPTGVSRRDRPCVWAIHATFVAANHPRRRAL